MSELIPSSTDPLYRETISDLSDLDTISRTHTRGLSAYQDLFGSAIATDRGLILDLGAGDSLFAVEVQESSDHQSEVVRLDAGYATVLPRTINRDGCVAAFGQELPFGNNTFDAVLGSFIFQHLRPEEARQTTEEIVRVLKPEGSMKLYASFKRYKQPDNPALENKKITTELAHRTLVLTKPMDFDEWTQAEKAQLYLETASFVTLRPLVYKLMRWGMARVIEECGTNRSVDGLTNKPFRTVLKSFI